jgi:hypothetical protein
MSYPQRIILCTAIIIIFLVSSCKTKDFPVNSHYPVNRPLLKQTAYVKLPLGSIKPTGWLRHQLIAQSHGLTGHLDEFWPDLIHSAWKGGHGETWERGPYYLDGLIPLAFLLDDERLIAKSKKWVHWIIQSSKKNGWFGPEKNSDRWPLAVGLKVLMQYYEATGDEKALNVMRKYFKYLSLSKPDWPDKEWRGVRAMENAVAGYWLYRRTGEEDILKAIQSIQQNSYNWAKYYYDFPWDSQAVADKSIPHNWKAEGLTAHVVNNAMAIKYPGLWYQQSKDEYFKKSVYEALQKYDLHHGQVGGRFSGDEHLSGRSPIQGTELCSVVEYMFSMEQLIEIIGDINFADRLEFLAYNSLPGTITPDYWAHQYDQQANQVLVTEAKRQWSTNGPTSNIYGLMPNYPCCLANMHQGWPKFVQTMWMATHDQGVAALTYGPCTVKVKVGKNSEVTIIEDTEYPFEGKIRFMIKLKEPASFPLYFRIPGWAEDVQIIVSGKTTSGVPGKMHKIQKLWHNGDIIELNIPFNLRFEQRFNHAVSILRGPLYYALRIGKDYKKIKIDTKYSKSIDYMGSVDWEIRPTTSWNYGLILNLNKLEKSIEVHTHKITRYPFADIGELIYDEKEQKYQKWPYEAPVVLDVQARKIESWVLKNNSASVLLKSPVRSKAVVETIQLVPYGCARLRISEFPLIQK